LLMESACVAGPYPHMQDVFGNTPLINLAKKNDQIPRVTLLQRLEAAVYLIEKGARVNHVNREGLSAITTAVRDSTSGPAGAAFPPTPPAHPTTPSPTLPPPRAPPPSPRCQHSLCGCVGCRTCVRFAPPRCPSPAVNERFALLLAEKGANIMHVYEYMAKVKGQSRNWVGGSVMSKYGA
jgi:hypothetical protein